MTQPELEKVSVSLISAGDGSDRVTIRLENGLDVALVLTPGQARTLATELISAVNRAEVKSSLKTTPNLWRRSGEPESRLATAG